ncbi:hypothetical protein A9Q74_14835 [Colwellia sp. 39_35_sub15_T18]|nr:hypothetical protein A9Q74_14835 [Colwellia sp. 39_35_sub15_T18]
MSKLNGKQIAVLMVVVATATLGFKAFIEPMFKQTTSVTGEVLNGVEITKPNINLNGFDGDVSQKNLKRAIDCITILHTFQRHLFKTQFVHMGFTKYESFYELHEVRDTHEGIMYKLTENTVMTHPTEGYSEKLKIGEAKWKTCTTQGNVNLLKAIKESD